MPYEDEVDLEASIPIQDTLIFKLLKAFNIQQYAKVNISNH